MEFRVDPDTWFVFSILFISGLGLFIVGFIAIPYLLRKKQMERLQFKFDRKSDRFDKIEKKISQRRETQLEKNNQKLKSDLRVSLREIAKNNRHEPETLTFFSDFEKIYPDFTSSLQKIIPNITSNEIKLCALLRLNLSAKEVSELLNITPESVNKARYRLRKKIGLQAKDDLDIYLLNISSSTD
ncbi:helix-turn-helix transcriptional regulator [Salegentibacter sp.]|uniref:helix-turn-helix transcriptional regulator n=1 Tax=Salegentibacter sp. TaxID=1903072 RepID=UPI003561DD41